MAASNASSSLVGDALMDAVSGSPGATGLALTAGAVIFTVYHHYYRTSSSKETRRYFPIAPHGMLETIREMSGDQINAFFGKCASEVGYTFRVRLYPFPLLMPVVVGDMELTREIYSDLSSTKPPSIYGGLESGFGRSIFTEPFHTKALPFRKGVAPAFSSAHIKRMNQVCTDHVERWIESVIEPGIQANEDGDYIDIDPCHEMIWLSIRAICESSFERVPSDEEMKKFRDDLRLYLKEFTFKQILNPARAIFPWFFPEVGRAYKAVESLKDFSRAFLKAYRANPNPRKGTVIDLIANNPNYANDEERVRDVFTFVFGGHDTTAFATVWIMMALAEHPEEQEKLEAALAEHLPTDRHNCPALHRVIQEGMRLNPVAASGPARELGREFTVTNPKDGTTTVLPKGTVVILSQLLANRNPDTFDRPNDFVPDRWKELSNSATVPFALGPRSCIGQGLAQAEMRSILSIVSSRYRLELLEPGCPMEYVIYRPVGAKIRIRRIKK